MISGTLLRPSLTTELLSSAEELSAFRGEWSRFVCGRGNSTPFHLPEWLITWWTYFGSGTVRTWVFRHGAQVAGVVPCFLHEWQGRRQLTLLGTGISDYLEPVCAPEHRSEIGAFIGRALERANDWDICVWQDLDYESALTEVKASSALRVSTEPDTSCSEIMIRGSFDQYWENRPHGLKRNFRRYLAKAKQIDTPQFSISCKADPESLSSLITLHTDRWHRNGQPGMLAVNRSAGFLKKVVPEFAASGFARLFSLRFQKKIAAVILAFAYRRVLYAYLSGFDPEYESFGFGRILLFEAIRHAFENGYTSWNFLRGIEPYKFGWGARELSKRRVIVHRVQ